MDKLGILVLHSLGEPNRAPSFLEKHVYSLRNTSPEHVYIYHDTNLPIPQYIKDTKFDAILLDVTFLCARWAQGNAFSMTKQSYDFVRESESVKIAFPQDEYDCNQLLDDWMTEWSVDVVFSVVSSNWEMLYPKYQRSGEIQLGYTAYVDDSMIDAPRRPFNQRSIDIGYRAKKLPPYFGRIGETKWTIGRDVGSLAKDSGLKVDIVLGDKGTLLGEAWRDFINNCKFTLGSNSGSSLLDPTGQIQRRVRTYLKNFPYAEFDEVERQCFFGLDGRYSFTAISPRVLEASLLESGQILVDGEYSGIIQPWEHYIPIRPDASNFPEVLAATRNEPLVGRLIRNSREAILSFDAIRQINQVARVLEIIKTLHGKKRVISNISEMSKAASRYQREMPTKYTWHWRQRALRQRVIQRLDNYPLLSSIARRSLEVIRRQI